MKWNPALEGRGIATQEEMQTFLENMKFEIKREQRTNAAQSVVNLVLYFTPFEEKYLNYIRRWSVNLYGTRSKLNSYYDAKSKSERLYYQYDMKNRYTTCTIRKYGPGGHCIHMGISLYNLSGSRYRFGRLRQPDLFRKKNKIIIQKEAPGDPYSKKLVKFWHDRESYLNGNHEYWSYPRKHAGLAWVKLIVRNYGSNGWAIPQASPCQNYIRRGLIRPLTAQEAARGYMVFNSQELASCGVSLATDEQIAQGGDNSHNGYCGYLEHMTKRVLTTNCIRGPKNIEHNNRPTQ